jgi:hypothetical protein
MYAFANTARALSARPVRRPLERTLLQLTNLEDRTAPAVLGFSAIGAPAGALPLVTISRADGSTLARITAYDPAFRGGVNATTAELDGNPNSVEVVTGAVAGGGPHVKVFSVNTANGATRLLSSFMAYDPSFRGGVNVAAGRIGDLATDSIITGPGPGGGPDIRIFRPDGSILRQFIAFNAASRTGVAVGPVSNGQFTVSALQGGTTSRFGLNAAGVLTSTVLNPGLPFGPGLTTPSAAVTNPTLAGVPAFTSPTISTPAGAIPVNSASAGTTAVNPFAPLNAAGPGGGAFGTPTAVTGQNNFSLPGTTFVGPVLPSVFGSNFLVGPNTPAVFFSPAAANTGTTPNSLTPFGGIGNIGGTFLPVGAFGGGIPSLNSLTALGPTAFAPGFGMTSGSVTSPFTGPSAFAV